MYGTSILFLVVGLLFGSLGIAIGKFKYLNLLSGYDPTKIKDKDGLAKWFGRIIQSISLISFLLCVLNYFIDTVEINTYSLIGFTVVTIILSLFAILGSKKYEIGK
jgi:Domain of unknown function (DUF3784)